MQNNKNVILIFGASGSGTSTLGKYISEQLSYTFLDIDDYYWLETTIPFAKTNEVAKCVEMLKSDIMNSDNVVLSGSLLGWGDEIIPMITLAVRLETSTKIRIERIQQRGIIKYGNRILPSGDMYEQHQGFVDRAAKYDKGGFTVRSKQLHDLWQSELACELVILSGEDSLEHNFVEVEKYLIKH